MTSAAPPKTQFDTTKDKSHLKKKYVPVDFKKLFVSRNIDKRLLCTSVCFMIPAWLHFSISSCAEYLGIWLGPSANLSHWNAQFEKSCELI